MKPCFSASLPLLLLAIATATFLTSCDPPRATDKVDAEYSTDDPFGTGIVPGESSTATTGSSELDYPLRAGLTDMEGRTINVVITGRSAEVVTFYRDDDPNSKRFDYPIENLSAEDRAFVDRLKIGGTTSMAVAVSSASPPPSSRELSAHQKRLQYIREDIARLEAKLEDIRSREAVAQTTSQKSALQKDRARVTMDLKEVRAEEEKLLGQIEGSR